MIGADKILDKLEAAAKELGVSHYCIIVQDPDSDEYGGRTGDTVWSVGAMTLYRDHLRKGSAREDA